MFLKLPNKRPSNKDSSESVNSTKSDDPPNTPAKPNTRLSIHVNYETSGKDTVICIALLLIVILLLLTKSSFLLHLFLQT